MLLWVILALVLPGPALSRAKSGLPVRWDFAKLFLPPKVYEDPEHSVEDVKAIFYEGLPWKGQPTRVFAYYGVPKRQGTQKVPAMVLVHGGGGSAFISWVRLWVSRGYAAISMDTCGCVSGGGYQNHTRHAMGGPPGWDSSFEQLDLPVEDQWPYHAVADVILAHSLIRSMPEVDPDKVGLTGISWGGYLTCLVAGVDRRFKFAAPVYGCGFLGENSVWVSDFQKMGPEKSRRWLTLWDPSQYLPKAPMPMLWLNGTNDFAYPMDSWQKSYRLPKGPRRLCLRVRMVHGHGPPGENPEEIHAIANALLKGDLPLAHISQTGCRGEQAWATFKSSVPVMKGELNYTMDMGTWEKREWKTLPAQLDVKARKLSAQLPKGVSVYYFNLVDSRGLIISSQHVATLAK